jgi:hypothetical protein
MSFPVPGTDAVVYDPGSAYSWDTLAESEFLVDVLSRVLMNLDVTAVDHHIHVFSSHDPDGVPALASEPSDKRRTLLFISDESGRVPVHLSTLYDHVFKTYLPLDRPPRDRIHAFPLGHVNGVPSVQGPPSEERDTAIYFSGNLNRSRHRLYGAAHPGLRAVPPWVARPLLEAGRSLGYPGMRRDVSNPARAERLVFTRRFRGGSEPGVYAAELADAKVVLCPPGFRNVETFRHYEALRAGAVIVTEQLPDTVLYRGCPLLTISTWEEGFDVARAVIDDAERLREIQRGSQRHFARVLAPAATAERMVRIIRQHEATG